MTAAPTLLPQPSASDRDRTAASPLFDAAWYQKTYADVSATGLDPLDHFLTYGTLMGRDPGPAFSTLFYRHIYGGQVKDRNVLAFHLAHADTKFRPKYVLQAAHRLGATGQFDLARQLAAQHLGPDLQHTLYSLDLQRAALLGDRPGWLAALTPYLARFDQAGLAFTTPAPPMEAPILSGLCAQDTLPPVTEGPLITVICAVFNMADHIASAIRSILAQTWVNLELIIMDDASTDTTWQVVSDLARTDPRIRAFRNAQNVGPYVSRNIAVSHARGAFLTIQDSDDWSHPQRLERHMAAHRAQASAPPVTMAWVLRLDDSGCPAQISRTQVEMSSDGFTRRNPVTALIDRSFFDARLGAWDCVKFGGDTELILRTAHLTGQPITEVDVISILYRDHAASLSNDPVHGTRVNNNKLSDVRRSYMDAITDWLAGTPAGTIAPFACPYPDRPFAAPAAMQVGEDAIRAVIDQHKG